MGCYVVVNVDAAQILSDFGDPYDHIELQTEGCVTVQSSTDTVIIVSDTSCIYGSYEVGYALYCLVEGSPARMFYSSSPNAITAEAICGGGFSANRLVLPLQDGGKSAIRLSSVSEDDVVVVTQLQDGGKAVKKLSQLNIGDVVTVVQLQDGGKVALKNEDYEHEIVDWVFLTQSRCTGKSIYLASGEKIRLRMSIRKTESGDNYAQIQFSTHHYVSPYLTATKILYFGDLKSTDMIVETPDLIAVSNGYALPQIRIEKGAYVQISNVMYSNDSGGSWNYMIDGNFALGDWQLNGQ